MPVPGMYGAVVELALALVLLALDHLGCRDGENGEEEQIQKLHVDFLEDFVELCCLCP